MSYAITVLEERLARFKSAADLERFSAANQTRPTKKAARARAQYLENAKRYDRLCVDLTKAIEILRAAEASS